MKTSKYHYLLGQILLLFTVPIVACSSDAAAVRETSAIAEASAITEVAGATLSDAVSADILPVLNTAVSNKTSEEVSSSVNLAEETVSAEVKAQIDAYLIAALGARP